MLNPGPIPFVMYVAVLGDHYGQTESTYYVHIGQRNRIAQVQGLSFCVFLEGIAAWVEKVDPLRLSRKHHRIRSSAASCVSFDLYLAVELTQPAHKGTTLRHAG